MNLNELDLVRANRIYGIANTPLFLVRKLQEDQEARAISEKYSGEEIVATLRDILSAEPTTSVEAVYPYVLLVALSFKPSIEHLQRAAEIETSIYSWYSYIAQSLILSFSPTKHDMIEVQGSLSSPSVSTNSSGASNTNIVKINDAA